MAEIDILSINNKKIQDVEARKDIQVIKENQINLIEDDTSMNGISDTVHDNLETANKTIIGGINEVNSQLKDIADELGDETLQTNAQDLKGAINEVFQNASNGKTLIAQAITGKGVNASDLDTFEQLAEKISQIQSNLLSVKTSQDIMYGYNGGSYILGCMLGNEISSDSSVPIITSSDKITVNKDSLDFTPANYSKYQNITVNISEDCSDSTGYIMIGNKKVKLNIISKTWSGGNKGTVNYSTNDIYLVEGEKTQLKISVSETPANDQPVIISCSDPYIKISNPMFNFNVGNTNDVYVEFESTEDGVIATRESIITVQSLDAIKTIKLISIDDEIDTEGQIYGDIKLTTAGGGYLTKTDSPSSFMQRVSLESQPSSYQIVNITSDNPNIVPSQSKIVFTPTRYNYDEGGWYGIAFNYIGEVDNGINEYATITFSSQGVDSKTFVARRYDTYFDGNGATEETPTDGLLLYYDFRNLTVEEGATSITINDKVSNLPMTIPLKNTTVDTNGIVFNNYGGIDVNISSIYDSMFSNINTNGLTLSYVSDEIGAMMQDYSATSIKIKSNNISIGYLDKDNNEKTTKIETGFFYDENKNIKNWHNNAIFTIILNPNGYVDCYCDCYRYFCSQKIKDFKQWNIKHFDILKFFISKNNRQTSYKIWNKALSYKEIMSNMLYEQSFTNVESITTTSLDEMYPNTESKVYTIIEPSYKKPAVNLEYTSENNNVSFNDDKVKVLNTGNYTFKTRAKSISNNTVLKEETKNLNVVENLTLSENESFSSTKTNATKVVITTPITDLEVGEEFALFAYVLPHYPSQDNLVKWSSSDNSVCSVNFGVLNAIKPGTVTITASTLDGILQDTMTVNIVAKTETVLSDSEIYTITLPCITTNGQLYINNTNAFKTTKAIIDLLKYASENNYKKIVFPKGTYLVTPDIVADDTKDIISFPSNLIVDFNNSIMNMDKNEKGLDTNTGYQFLSFSNNISNTKLMNLHFIGEKDKTSDKTKEGNIVLHVADCHDCELENVIIERGTGFSTTTDSMQRKNTGFIGITELHIEQGGIDENGQPKTEIEDGVWRVSDWYCNLNEKNMTDVLQLCPIHGYMGRQPVSRTFDIFYYDENKSFIKAEYDNMQGYSVPIPTGAYYCKVVVYQTEKPKNWNDPIWYAMCLSVPGMSYNNKFKNCIFKNSNTMNFFFGGRHNVYDGCQFIQSEGIRICSTDIEDGWERTSFNIWKNCIFDGNTFAICGGGTQIFHNNIFKNVSINVAVRAFAHRWYLNEFQKGGVLNFTGHQEDAVVAMNIINGGQIKIGTSNYHGADTQYKTRAFKNITIS